MVGTVDRCTQKGWGQPLGVSEALLISAAGEYILKNEIYMQMIYTVHELYNIF